MADLTLQERLQPSLLDRLTDREPDVQRESRDRRIISEERLRESVTRDLIWLLNTANLESSEDLSDVPYVRRSVLNYGVPDFAGLTASSVDASELEQALKQAIASFEPRLLPDTLKVRVAADANAANHNAVSFRIEAELWGQPAPIGLTLRTEVDLESGNFSLTESSR